MLTGLLFYERFSRIIFIAGGFLQQLGLILGFDFQNDLLDVLAVGTLGFRLVAVEIPVRRMHGNTKLFIVRLRSFVIRNMSGCSPLARVLLLKQITEIVASIAFWRFTPRFTQTA